MKKLTMENKVFIITGTRKGLGKQLSEYYIENGHYVAGCSRSEGSIIHPNYEHFCLDVSDEKAVISMVKAVTKKYGRIDILINNAGIASMNHFLLTPLQTVHDIFNTNFIGTFLFTREAAKVMVRQKKGRIVNFATVATPLRLEGESIYAASKAAIVNFTEVSAKELSPFGITVNAVGPTPILTDLIKSVPKNKIDALIQLQTIKRLGEFNDLKNVVDFYIDDNSDFISGQTIYLGGVNN